MKTFSLKMAKRAGGEVSLALEKNNHKISETHYLGETHELRYEA